MFIFLFLKNAFPQILLVRQKEYYYESEFIFTLTAHSYNRKQDTLGKFTFLVLTLSYTVPNIVLYST